MGPSAVEAYPAPEVDARVPWHEAAIRLPRPRTSPIEAASTGPLRAAKPVVAGVEGAEPVVRAVRPAGHGAKVPATRISDVEEAEGSAIGAPVPGTMQAFVGGSVGRTAATTTDVGAEVGPPTGRP